VVDTCMNMRNRLFEGSLLLCICRKSWLECSLHVCKCFLEGIFGPVAYVFIISVFLRV